MDQKKANYYLYRVYRLLNSERVLIIFKKIRKKAGETDYQTIWLNHHDDILSTLIHECLHVLYPTWSETKVLQYEKQIFNKLTPRQINNLIIRLASVIEHVK